jgi:hypothetical protein
MLLSLLEAPPVKGNLPLVLFYMNLVLAVWQFCLGSFIFTVLRDWLVLTALRVGADCSTNQTG